jgi:hypothetical protein
MLVVGHEFGRGEAIGGFILLLLLLLLFLSDEVWRHQETGRRSKSRRKRKMAGFGDAPPRPEPSAPTHGEASLRGGGAGERGSDDGWHGDHGIEL